MEDCGVGWGDFFKSGNSHKPLLPLVNIYSWMLTSGQSRPMNKFTIKNRVEAPNKNILYRDLEEIFKNVFKSTVK